MNNLKINIIIGVLWINFSCFTVKADDLEHCVLNTPASTLIVNVLDMEARPNDDIDDTKAIQSAINKIAGTGGTVLIPKGKYLIDALVGIQLKSDITLLMDKATILKAIPNDKSSYSIININDASRVNIKGGTLIGDRDDHAGTIGEWGMGIMLRNANNILIQDLIAKNCWGDGFYISGNSKNVNFCSVTADNNRRQGMSIISVDGMYIKGSTFSNTKGTPPQAGIDLEPNVSDIVSNVEIINSYFYSNKGLGIQSYQGAKNSIIRRILIHKNIVIGNSGGGIGILDSSGHCVINNDIKDNQVDGITLLKSSNNFIINNKLLNNLLIDYSGKNILSGNINE